MRANRILAIGTTTWRVLAAFDFAIQDLSGRAALVEGATLLLLRPDTLLEGIPLLEIDEIGDGERVGGRESAVFRANVTLRDGRSLLLSGELPDLDLLQRWVGYLRTRQRREAGSARASGVARATLQLGEAIERLERGHGVEVEVAQQV